MRTVYKAYMTLEASLIMPFVLYVCIIIIYLGFFMYDRCILTQDCYRIALRGSSIYKDDNQAVLNIAQLYKGKITADKVITRNFHYQIEVNHQVVVKCFAEYTIPLTHLKKLTGNEMWTIESEGRSNCINAALWLRLCHRLLRKDNMQEGK